MKTAYAASGILALSLVMSAPAMAGSGSITILSPHDGDELYSNSGGTLAYEVTLGPGDDHFHVWTDDAKGPGVRTLKGAYTLPALTPGEHVITLKLVDKGHVPTGVERSITISVE